jgi:hypothetical protein
LNILIRFQIRPTSVGFEEGVGGDFVPHTSWNQVEELCLAAEEVLAGLFHRNILQDSRDEGHAGSALENTLMFKLIETKSSNKVTQACYR